MRCGPAVQRYLARHTVVDAWTATPLLRADVATGLCRRGGAPPCHHKETTMTSTHWAAVLALAACTTTPAFAADGDKMQSFDRWATDWSAAHNGRITRDAYMEEMGRRWDAMDRNRQGLTPRELSAMTGKVDSGAQAPITGSGVQAGNMGPGNSKGK
jgi:hypothetical protein